MAKVAIIGSGHAACAFAAYLGRNGHEVHMYDSERFAGNLAYIQEHHGLAMIGAATGFGEIQMATTNLAEAVRDVEIILVVVPAFAHKIIARDLASHLNSSHIVVLNPGSVFGALEFLNTLRECGNHEDITIAEAASSVFACRRASQSEVRIKGIKKWMPVGCIPSGRISEVAPKLKAILENYEAAPNIIYSSFLDINAIVHPIGALLNAGRIEFTKGQYDFYWDGLTEGVCRCMEAIDREKVAVSRAMGHEQISLLDLIHRFYGCEDKKSLYAYFYKGPVNGGPGSTSPTDMKHRYITEDVPYGLVPISDIARIFGVPTPCIDAVISLSSAINGENYMETGRSLKNLGLGGLDRAQVLRRLFEGR